MRRLAKLLSLPILLLAVQRAPAESPAVADDLTSGFVRGYTWGWDGQRGDYQLDRAAESMARLADTGVTHVCIAFAAVMKSPESPEFVWGDKATRMVSDEDIRHAIALAREHNLKVILKPTVNCADGTWRAWIRFYRQLTDEEKAEGLTGVDDPWGPSDRFRAGEAVDLKKWERWWTNYHGFLMHYAKLAAEEGVGDFCLGCEMSSTESFVEKWRAVIRDVRGVYSGRLTYNCNHGREELIEWWDTLDYVSISAYYQIPPPEGATVDEAAQSLTPKSQMIAEFERVKARLKNLSEAKGKPVLFIETGVTNVLGAARYPWTHANAKMESPVSDEEQRLYYEAMFETFWGEPWFRGFCWWDWPAKLYAEDWADGHRSFCIYGRPAEKTLRQWYAKPAGAR